jgi:hypothetical protein
VWRIGVVKRPVAARYTSLKSRVRSSGTVRYVISAMLYRYSSIACCVLRSSTRQRFEIDSFEHVTVAVDESLVERQK